MRRGGGNLLSIEAGGAPHATAVQPHRRVLLVKVHDLAAHDYRVEPGHEQRERQLQLGRHGAHRPHDEGAGARAVGPQLCGVRP